MDNAKCSRSLGDKLLKPISGDESDANLFLEIRFVRFLLLKETAHAARIDCLFLLDTHFYRVNGAHTPRCFVCEKRISMFILTRTSEFV